MKWPFVKNKVNDKNQPAYRKFREGDKSKLATEALGDICIFLLLSYKERNE